MSPARSVGCIQGAKGGEADDALKRVILDFHSNQLAAGKQAVIALLSGMGILELTLAAIPANFSLHVVKRSCLVVSHPLS